MATLQAVYGWAVVPDGVYTRAISVQRDLTNHGTHRSAGPIDLLVAATAEGHRMTVLHYDRDFEQVAAVTGQRTEWVADSHAVD